MYHNVDVPNDIIKNVGSSKISSDSRGEQVPVFRSTGFHLIGFGLGPPCPSNLDPAFEEKVDNVGTDKACGASDENMTGRGMVVLVRA